MSTLHYRRLRGDIIETYKIVCDKYDAKVAPILTQSGMLVTRGNDLRLLKTYFKYDLRKYYFSDRVVDIWNSLPNWVVTAFKRRLDIYFAITKS